jgi:BirA family biotin operon repressor/biotin-[acetyl-CoA-carboxylase] ligase
MAGGRAIPSWDVQRHSEVDSTNTVLLGRAKAGAPEGLVIVADRQTAGRGRLGRTWQAPPGASLLTSVLVRPGPDLALGHAYLLTAALALAAADAVGALAGVDVGLKWPNDLVIERHDETRKLGGILAESIVEGGQLGAVVLGIGVNVHWPAELPPELTGIAVALNHLSDAPVEVDELLGQVLDGFGGRYVAVLDPGRRPSVTAEYRARCATIGRPVRIELGGEEIVGLAVELSDEGHLGVDTAGERRWVAAGDVTHVRTG